MTYKTDRDKILIDPAISEWLKAAIVALGARDPVDAVEDAKLLVSLMRQRCDEHFDGLELSARSNLPGDPNAN